MLATAFEAILRNFCGYKNICFEDFYAFFASIERKKQRLGTSDFSNLLVGHSMSEGFK
jgi:hypothetical protein